MQKTNFINLKLKYIYKVRINVNNQYSSLDNYWKNNKPSNICNYK